MSGEDKIHGVTVFEFHVEGMRLRGEPVPEPTSVAETIEVRAA